MPKIQAVLDAGLTPLIKVVHANPEIALQHTFNRFNELGRGAGINIMATIQGSLPNGLQKLYEEVGELVKLEIFDSRKSNNPKKIIGWQYLDILKSEGDYATIKQRLETELERARNSNSISEDCYCQAAGKAPHSRREMGSNCATRLQENGSGRGIQKADRQEFFLKMK